MRTDRIVDKEYCMSSFLTYRTIADKNYIFAENMIPHTFQYPRDLSPVNDSVELESLLKKKVERTAQSHKAALALSGGIDSAILARFMPKGSLAYTFKCIVPGKKVTDETERAALYAKECGLEHRIIEVCWEDMLKYAPILMKHKGAPIHSIEVQIYMAGLRAKADGIDALIFGESADLNYGGLSGLLSKEWSFGEFVDRYSYVKPYYALKNPRLVLEPFRKYARNGYVDVHGFNNGFFKYEALESYMNAMACADVKLYMPYAESFLNVPLDMERIRRGENKYLVREVFNRLYPGFSVPEKTPMPRPMTEWLENWGATREEFLPDCVHNLTGDQKWLVYSLEMFLNILDRM